MFGRKKLARSVEVDDEGTVLCSLCGGRSRLLSADRCALGHRVTVRNAVIPDEVGSEAVGDVSVARKEEPESSPTAVTYERRSLFGGLADGAAAPPEQRTPPAADRPAAEPPARPAASDAPPAPPAEPVEQPETPAEPAVPGAEAATPRPESASGDEWGFDELLSWDEDVVTPSSLDV